MRTLEAVRGFLLDMDGTFYLGEHLLPGAARFLDVLSAQGKKHIFLTNNSSRNRSAYAQKFTRLGVHVPEECILTSSDAAARHLQARHPGARVYVAGTPDLEDEFRSAGFTLDAQKPQAVVLGYDTGLTYERLCRLCDHIRQGLPYIATHADLNCPSEAGPLPDAGAVIAYVHAATGREPDMVIGKPNCVLVDIAAQTLGLPREELAMVGDRLYTDIALGAACGICTVLVLSGETSAEAAAASIYIPDHIFQNLGALADHLAASAG